MEPALKPVQSLSGRGLFALLTVLFALAVTLLYGVWPDVYGFVNPREPASLQSLISAPVRLSDDVMITLRSGYIVNEVGRPALNRRDLAQPSTSYLLPYLFSFLLKVCSRGTAVLIYAFLGLFAVALTLSFLVLYSRSMGNAVILVVALLLTTTNFAYALNGWDHLHQAAFLTLATCIALRGDVGPARMLLVAVLLALGTASRPDGFLISIGVLVTLCLGSRKISQTILFAVAPFSLFVGGILVLNFHQFGHLTATTARLKIGAAPSSGYIIRYLIENGVFSYSVLTLFVVLLSFYFAYCRVLLPKQTLPIVVCCVLTASIASYNSDYFAGARMLWSATCVLAAAIVVVAPAWFVLSRDHLKSIFARSQTYKGYSGQDFWPAKVLLGILAVLVMCILYASTLQKARAAVLSRNAVYTSPTAQQYVIARWMEENLSPRDGAIGLFFLGVSYDLPRFEIADFLGKGDESIAVLKVKAGPPGHNKWDLDKTLSKWDVQAIVPAGPSDPNNPETRENSHKHAPDLLSNQKIAKEFAYCYVSDELGIPDRWGFFLRRDIANLHPNELRCS